MSARPSRAYKLKLSPAGIGLFLDCHCRVCHLAGDLLPYGTTLRIAVTAFATRPMDEVMASVDRLDWPRFAGDNVRFVGTSPDLALVTADMIGRLRQYRDRPAVQTWRLFIAALCNLRSAADNRIVAAYQMLCQRDEALARRG